MFEKIKYAFRDHPWQNTLSIILVVLLGVTAFFYFNGKLVKKGDTKVVFFPGTEENYYVPNTAAESGSSDALPKKAAEVKTAALTEGLYNYGNHALNISTGLRKSTITSYRDWLFSIAKAVSTRSYPVTYYCDLTQDPAIVEINGLTGEKKTILTEKYSITSLNFSEANQALVYTVASSADQNNNDGRYPVN